MESFCQKISLCCGLYKRVCCVPDMRYLPTCNVTCIGLSNVGKSRMLAALNNENLKTEPTIGFNVKAVKLSQCIVNIKELGGSDNVRKFWPMYFANTESLMVIIKLSNPLNLSEDVANETQKLSEVFKLHKEQDLPILIIISSEFFNEFDESMLMINEVIGQITKPSRSLILVVSDLVKDCDQVKETLNVFCLRFLLN